MEAYLNPSKIEKLFQLGDQFFLAGKYEKALKAYHATATLEPSARRYYSMALVFMRAKKIDTAYKIIKDNIERYPLYYKNFALAADISILKQDYTAATEYLKKELNINPWQAHRCCLAGNIYIYAYVKLYER